MSNLCRTMYEGTYLIKGKYLSYANPDTSIVCLYHCLFFIDKLSRYLSGKLRSDKQTIQSFHYNRNNRFTQGKLMFISGSKDHAKKNTKTWNANHLHQVTECSYKHALEWAVYYSSIQNKSTLLFMFTE